MENNSQRKEILIRKDKIISYDSQNCYVNDNIQTSTEPEQPFIHEEMANKEKISFYNSFFRKHFQHVVVLSAAGTSRDNGEDELKCGKTRDGLWEYCHREIDALENDINSLKSRNFYLNKDIENLLSYVILYSKINDSNDTFQNKISTLENKIAEACRLELQIDSPHKLFLDKITARKPSDSRIQLFTTNYDTLFEQAAQAGGFVIIDGFSFTQPRVFSGRYFDYDIVNRERTRLKQ